MKKIVWLVAGLSTYAAYRLLNQALVPTTGSADGISAAAAPAEDLAHKLQDAWADHHTVA